MRVTMRAMRVMRARVRAMRVTVLTWKKKINKEYYYLTAANTVQITVSGFSFEAGGRTFHPVVFYSMSGTLISIFEGLFIILL